MVAMQPPLGTRRRYQELHAPLLRPKTLALWFGVLLAATFLEAQNTPPQPSTQPVADYSGMYAFLREGEFIQLTVEDEGQITGFISRYGDSDADRGAFVDHFIKEGKLAGKKLYFSTETAKGVRFEFRGAIDRGTGKTAADEAYYVLKGILTRHEVGANNKSTSKSQEVSFPSFPQDVDSAPRNEINSALSDHR
jgi:hypothetical protein